MKRSFQSFGLACLLSLAVTGTQAADIIGAPTVEYCRVAGTSNLLLLHTDRMGTVGTVSIAPGVEQTAYGVFIDLVDLMK